MIQQIVHYSLHFIAPGFIAWFFFNRDWKRVWLIFLMTMVVDIDHLLAVPIFDPGRCGIGFHPFHSLWAISIYLLSAVIGRKWWRIIAIGLLFHMFTDLIDCFWMFDKCRSCFENSIFYS